MQDRKQPGNGFNLRTGRLLPARWIPRAKARMPVSGMQAFVRYWGCASSQASRTLAWDKRFSAKRSVASRIT